MNTERHQRAKEIFLAALERPRDERTGYVMYVAGEDDALVSEVVSLLAFHHEGEEESAPPPRELLSPGELFAGRFRIVRMLGRGGMGEVYHAHDERVDMPVAIKRLLRRDRHGSGSIINEVRLARRVTHPFVCRVFDLGEHDGAPFISMEYVDGEDLASLLRRVGRLPSERVAEIGRSLCIGLAAAHAQGVLHRDLKPANILLDAAGNVRITDFGIATRTGANTFAIAGTPSYMAPEQLVGGTVTERSDLYALGLVLHELLTGEPVFRGSGRTEVLELHQVKRIPAPSKTATGIEPSLDRAVRKALRADPAQRFATALEMAAALPGGDPLAAALAAKVTPSPELVAQAPSRDQSKGPFGVGVLLVGLVITLACVLGLGSELEMIPGGSAVEHPAVGAHRAGELFRSLGYAEEESAYRGFLMQPGKPGERSSLLYWYREDGAPFRSTFQRTILDPAGDLIVYGAVTPPDAGRRVAVYNTDRNLVYFEASGTLPEDRPRSGPAAGPAAPGEPPPYMRTLLSAAGLDPLLLVPADPARAPVIADETAAWRAPAGGDAGGTLRVEAAYWNGLPTYFSAGPEEEDVREALQAKDARLAPFVIAHVLIVGFLLSAVVLWYRNTRSNRSDRAATQKLAFLVAALALVEWFLLIGHMSHPLADRSEMLWSRFFRVPMMWAVIMVFYPALEPGVRRYWPQTLVAWMRALRGNFRNQAVGRSLLLGTLVGTGWALLYLVDMALPSMFDLVRTAGIDDSPRLLAALGITQEVSVLLRQAYDAIGRGVTILFIFVMLRQLLRHPVIAGGVLALVLAFLESNTGGHHALSILTVGLPIGILSAWVLAASGLLTYVVAGFAYCALRFSPLTLDSDAWFAPSGFLAVAVVFLIGVAGAFLAGKSRATIRDGSAIE